MSASITGFPHRQDVELFAAPIATPQPPPGPAVPLFPHWAPPDRPRQSARLVSTPAQVAAAQAAAQHAAMRPDPNMERWLENARAQVEDGRLAAASIVRSDTVADTPRVLW